SVERSAGSAVRARCTADPLALRRRAARHARSDGDWLAGCRERPSRHARFSTRRVLIRERRLRRCLLDRRSLARGIGTAARRSAQSRGLPRAGIQRGVSTRRERADRAAARERPEPSRRGRLRERVMNARTSEALATTFTARQVDRKASASLVWQALKVGAQIAQYIVLSRLVDTDEFGIFALAAAL